MTVTDIRTGPSTGGPDALSPGLPSPAGPSPAAPSGMLPLSLFGVPLGLAGLGAGWSAARATLGAPAWPEEVLYGAASAIWLILTTVYLLRGLRRKGAFRADLRHEIAGPFASFIPLVGILLSAHYSEYLPALGAWVCVAFIAALTVVATQLFAHWITGGISMQSIHPPVGHFAFDDAGVGALPAWGQEFMQDFAAEDGEGFGQAFGGKRPGARRGNAWLPGGSV